MSQTPTATRAPGRAFSPRPAPRHRPRIGRRLARLTPYALLLPAVLLIGGLLLYPAYRMLVMSFQNVGLPQISGVLPAENVGAGNYTDVLTDPDFWHALLNTALFAVAAVSSTLVVGTLVGLLLHRLGRVMSTIVATGAMLAWGTPQITGAIVFKFMFDDTYGLANQVMRHVPAALTRPVFGNVDWSEHSWVLSTQSEYFLLLLCIVWMGFPFIAVSVLAGLKSVPSELYEAARVDGAGPWRSFWSITFPVLKPIFSILGVLSVIWDFKVFTQLYVINGGLTNKDGFNLSLYSYSKAFGFGAQMGLGAAIAIILTVLLLIITGLYIRQMVRTEGLA
ncbi:MAG TPA: sugar ABC transporter permease [Streptosporangiaceae bacterium]|jgi:N,N'-diacetylchitobiose transport system permease protein